MPALLTEMTVLDVTGTDVSGKVSPPAYWLKSGRPTDW
jgi:hypothetical protein